MVLSYLFLLRIPVTDYKFKLFVTAFSELPLEKIQSFSFSLQISHCRPENILFIQNEQTVKEAP